VVSPRVVRDPTIGYGKEIGLLLSRFLGGEGSKVAVL